ncbi:MAG TPA: hypothetical protein EYQ42_07270 [Thiotrichaceae bacterium]|jgi:redox-sensitive bicupin YhaK (pirin superfamily)|nr:hypothetical protein [Thiotrichaceae bacterium]HIM06927.1 hypothetical protein [Gammaproteobacteria bacterium]
MIENNTINDTENNNDTQKLLKGMLAVLDDGDEVLITTTTSSTKCMLMSAPPLNEAVARGGPFVMNTRAESIQASRNYESGKF